MSRNDRSGSSSGSQRAKPDPAYEGRNNFLRNEKYFMAVALLSAQRSRDPHTQVGACIVNSDNNIVGVGFNKMPHGCEGRLPWAREGETLDTKYVYVCHAELNAIISRNAVDLKGCTIYVTLFPCNECAKLIIQSGIRKVVYLSDKYHNEKKTIASRRMLENAGITLEAFQACEDIVITFRTYEQEPE